MPNSSPVLFGIAGSEKSQADTTTLPANSSSDLVQQVNEEVYKQNFELAVRNKTLSALRSLYPVSMSSVKVSEVAQKIIDAITKELQIPEALVHIIDYEEKTFHIIAVTQSENTKNVETTIGKKFLDFSNTLDMNSPFLSRVINNKISNFTEHATDIFCPAVSEDAAKSIQNTLDIQIFMVYPLVFDEKVFGTLTLGFSKENTELSRSEKETIEELLSLISIAIDRAKLFEDLQKANTQLQELDKLKDEFVSLASHELRTPMAAIKGSLSTILEGYAGNISPETREFLSAAYNENDRLIRVVNNLLNTSRIQSGKMSFNMSRLDLPTLINDVVKNLQVAAKEKKLYLTYDPSGFLPHVIADDDKLREILINLIGNALKFTTIGGISIGSKIDGDFVVTHVTDTGTGIHQEHFDLLFKKFSQLKTDYTKTIGGTGLGLYISKKIIEGIGGKIWLTSEVGKGTTFYFTLPIAK